MTSPSFTGTQNMPSFTPSDPATTHSTPNFQASYDQILKDFNDVLKNMNRDILSKSKNTLQQHIDNMPRTSLLPVPDTTPTLSVTLTCTNNSKH